MNVIIYDPHPSEQVTQLIANIWAAGEDMPTVQMLTIPWSVFDRLEEQPHSHMIYGPSCVPLAATGQLKPFPTAPGILLVLGNEPLDSRAATGPDALNTINVQAATVLGVRGVVDLTESDGHDWLREQVRE